MPRGRSRTGCRTAPAARSRGRRTWSNRTCWRRYWRTSSGGEPRAAGPWAGARSGHARRRPLGGGDGRRAHHARAVVEHDRLAGGDTAHRFGEADAQFAVDGLRRHLGLAAVGTQLGGVGAGADGGGAAPAGADRGEGGDVEGVRGADGDGVVDRGDVEDVAGLAVGGGGADPQALAVADGEAVGALVGAHLGAGLIDDVALGAAEAVGEEAPGVAVGDEADVVRVGLLGDGESAALGLGADLLLGGDGVTEGEHRVGELPVVEHPEDVRLVLGHVGGAVQLARAVLADDHLGVVAGAHGVEAEGQRLVQQGGELDLLVAAQARVGGAAGLVLGDEVLDDVLAEPVGEVPHVEGDADDVGGATGVAGVLDGATTPRAGAEGLRVRGEREVDAGHVVAGLGGTGRGDGGVDSAGHGGQDAEGAGALRGVSHNPSRVRGRGNHGRRVSVEDRMGARGASEDGDRRIGRRALIVGGVAAAAGTAVLARDELARLWWRAPGVEKPRTPGEVDFAGARWIAASEANWRRADRPDDYGIDMVVVHVTQGSFDSAVKAFQDPGHRAATHYIVGQD